MKNTDKTTNYKGFSLDIATGGTILIKKNNKVVSTAYTIDEAKNIVDKKGNSL